MQQLRLIDKKQLADSVWRFDFEPERPVEYVPGQYAALTFPYPIADPRGKQHRTFSFTSHPSESHISFITRLEQPLSAFKQPLADMQPGMFLRMDEPHGDAILPRLDTTPVLFVAQGIAIASYLSMLQEIKFRQLPHPVSLIWIRRPEDAPLSSLIPAISFRHHIELTYPQQLTAAYISRYDVAGSLIYLSGSQTFVETLGEALEEVGIPRERIIYDYYSGYAEL